MKHRFGNTEEWEIESAVTDGEDFCYEFFNAVTQDRRFLNTVYAYGLEYDDEEYTDNTELVYSDEDWLTFSLYNHVLFNFEKIDGAFEFVGLEIIEEEEE